MSVGLGATKQTIDQRGGGACLNLRNAIDEVARYKNWLDTKTEQDLIDLGYTSGEVAILKSAFTDLAQLADIYYGRSNLTNAKDFTTFAKQLTGDL